MKKLLLGMGVCLLCVTCAYAARIRASDTVDAPGIDEAGMCDLELGGPMLIKASINTSNGKFKGAGKANVENEGNGAVKIENSDDILECFDETFFISEDETVDRALYKVSKSGKARLSIKGTAPVPAV